MEQLLQMVAVAVVKVLLVEQHLHLQEELVELERHHQLQEQV
jgi:hypothetical protein